MLSTAGSTRLGPLPADLGVQATDDAAVLALAYRRSGTRMLERLRGSFSLVVWDTARGRGVLGCDLLATRQLFLSRADGALVFATELHELLPLLPRSPAPDAVAFTRWLADGTCPEGQTLYEGVRATRARHADRTRCRWRSHGSTGGPDSRRATEGSEPSLRTASEPSSSAPRRSASRRGPTR